MLVHAGFLAAFALRFGGTFPAANFHAYLRAAPGLTALAVALLLSNGLYDFRSQSWRNVVSGLVVAVTLLPLGGMALTFVARAFALPRTVFVIAWGVQLAFLLAWRNVAWRVSLRMHGPEVAVIVGPVDQARDFARRLTSERHANYRVAALAVIGERPSASSQGPGAEEAAAAGEMAAGHAAAGQAAAGQAAAGQPAAGAGIALPTLPFSGLEATLREGFDDGKGRAAPADVLIITPGATLEDKAHVADLASRAGARVLLIPDYRDLLVLDARTAQIDDSLVFEVGTLGLPSQLAWAKRLIDIALAAAGLAVTLPFYPFIALAAKLSSPGPVFYSQERVGLGERVYRIHKFRTMRADAEVASGPVLAKGDDPRVTGSGRFLRRYRLDELPQLFNILFGSMSLVGPRPERPEFVRRYEAAIPYYRHRHLLKPGLTGLAQLYARYDTPVEEKLRFDLLYAKRYSLLLDMRILFLTARVALKGDEAHWRDANHG